MESAYQAAYRKANAEKEAYRKAAYNKANAEKINSRQSAYLKANAEKIASRKAAYYKANAEKEASRKAAYNKANAEKLSDVYISTLLGIPLREAPHELIEMKREQLLLKRALSELNKTLKEHNEH